MTEFIRDENVFKYQIWKIMPKIVFSNVSLSPLFSLQAHRVVLSACSDYFRAMFTDPMRERSQDEIQLSGIDAKGLELVLEYIYTSKLSLDLSNIQTVLSTATHLQILQVPFLQIDFTRISEYSSILRPKNRVYI